MLRSIPSRLTHVGVMAAVGAFLMLAGVAFAASSAVRRTAAGHPPAITIAPGAHLYVATVAPSAGRARAWVVFRTVKHVNARLTVVRVHGTSGRSYAAAGAANCIRSAIPARGTALQAGKSYPVTFYSRANTGIRSPRKLVATRQLTATGFGATFPPPHC